MSEQGQLKRERVGLLVLIGYCAILLLAPPLPFEVEFASRGLKLDQLLLLPIVLALARTDSMALSQALRERSLGPAWAFAALSALSALWSLAFVPSASTGGAVAGTWGTIRVPLVLLLGLMVGFRMGAASRRAFAQVLLGLGVAIALFATAQLFRWEPFYGVSVAAFTRKSDFDLVLEALNVGRAYGTFDGQPNVLGSFGVLILALAGAELVEARSGSRKAWLAVAGTAALWIVAVSWSRGAYAGALAVVCMIAWRIARSRPVFSAFLVGAIVVAVYCALPDAPRERIAQLLSGSGSDTGESIFDTRLPYWQTNWNLFLQSPLLGLRTMEAAPLDSLYLGLLLVHGLAGGLAFALMIGIAVSTLMRSSEGAPALRVACLMATVGWLINGISVPSFFGERVQELYFLTLGVSLARLPGTVAETPSASVAAVPLDPHPIVRVP